MAPDTVNWFMSPEGCIRRAVAEKQKWHGTRRSCDKVLYERVKQYPGWESLYQKDTYREEYWLEIGDLYNLKSGTIEERVSVKAIPDDIV